MHINHRRIPVKHIGRDEKVVFMRDPKKCYESGRVMKEFEARYLNDWNGYYAINEKAWKKFCRHQAEGKTKYFDKEEPM